MGVASAHRPSCCGAPTECSRARAGRGGARAAAGLAPCRPVLSPRPPAAPAPSLPRELRTAGPRTQPPAPAPLSVRPRGGLQAAGSMSGGGDVVCTGWLRKSPPEKKLRRYVSAGGQRARPRRVQAEGALRPAGGLGAPGATCGPGGRAPGPPGGRGTASAPRDLGLCEAPAHLSQVRRRGAGRAGQQVEATAPSPRGGRGSSAFPASLPVNYIQY